MPPPPKKEDILIPSSAQPRPRNVADDLAAALRGSGTITTSSVARPPSAAAASAPPAARLSVASVLMAALAGSQQGSAAASAASAASAAPAPTHEPSQPVYAKETLRTRLAATEAASAAENFPRLADPARRLVAASFWTTLTRGVESDAAAAAQGTSSSSSSSSGFPSSTFSYARFLGEKAAAAVQQAGVLPPAALQQFAEALEGALYSLRQLPPRDALARDVLAAARPDVGPRTSGSSSSGGGSSGSSGGSGGGQEAAAEAAAPPPSSELSDFYRSQTRSLMACLAEPRNRALRLRLLTGELAPLTLAGAGEALLLPPEDYAHVQRTRDEGVRRSDLTRSAEAVEIFNPYPRLSCVGCRTVGQCSGRMAGGAGQQRDIRKAEIWGTSGGGEGECSMSFRCEACGHRWEGVDVST